MDPLRSCLKSHIKAIANTLKTQTTRPLCTRPSLWKESFCPLVSPLGGTEETVWLNSAIESWKTSLYVRACIDITGEKEEVGRGKCKESIRNESSDCLDWFDCLLDFRFFFLPFFFSFRHVFREHFFSFLSRWSLNFAHKWQHGFPFSSVFA